MGSGLLGWACLSCLLEVLSCAQSDINHAERTGGQIVAQYQLREGSDLRLPTEPITVLLTLPAAWPDSWHPSSITNLQAEVQSEGERQDEAGRHGGHRHGPHSPSPTRFHHGANKFLERPVGAARVPGKRLARAASQSIPSPSRPAGTGSDSEALFNEPRL